MTALDIEAIRERAAKVTAIIELISSSSSGIVYTAGISAADVPVLLAEIEAQAEKITELQLAVGDGLIEVARLTRELDELVTETAAQGAVDSGEILRLTRELDEMRELALALTEERDAARADVRDAASEMRKDAADMNALRAEIARLERLL